MADRLTEIQSDMAFMGWKGDAAKGFSHKVDADDNIVARAHDAIWLADFEEADARAARLEAIREIERRAILAHPKQGGDMGKDIGGDRG